MYGGRAGRARLALRSFRLGRQDDTLWKPIVANKAIYARHPLNETFR